MFYDATKNDHGLQIDPIKAIVAPRPIGWISTMSVDGVANLAPYSFFNLFSTEPHYVAFGSGGYKHTLSNIEKTPEFAVNLATYELREAMNISSGSYPAHVDEFALAGVTKAPCEFIKVPRVLECKASLECRHYMTIPLPNDDGHINDWLVIGRVLGFHIDDSALENGRVNSAGLRIIARLGYSEYATIDETWRMRRPD